MHTVQTLIKNHINALPPMFMVPILDDNSEIGAHMWSVISVVLDLELSNVLQKRQMLLHTCETCSELPSDNMSNPIFS